MPTYTDIAASETEPNAPVTAPLMQRLVDNPIAMFEGAANAPRLDEGARQGSVAGDLVLFQAFGKGNTFVHTGLGSASPWEIVPGSRFRATTACGLRCTCTVDAALNGGQVQVVKNGTQIAAATSGVLTVDVTLTDGDTCWFEVRAGSGAGGGELSGSITLSDVAYRTGTKRSCGGC